MPRKRRLPRSQTIRGGYSPTYEQKVDELLSTRTMKGVRKKYIQDICDFCLGYRYMLRYQFNLKKKNGWKFLCKECTKNDVAKYQKGVLPCFTKSELIKMWSAKNKKKNN